MITGIVQPGRQAIVHLQVKGRGGNSIAIDGILDTGFTEALTLPYSLVLALRLRFLNIDSATLADGSVILVELYEGTVVWNGQDRHIIVHCLEGDPLIGMSLIYSHHLAMDAVDHGAVTLTPLP